jgi:hypothetical protein
VSIATAKNQKQNQVWGEISEIVKNLLTDGSILNYPVEKPVEDFFVALKNWMKYLAIQLKKYFNELEHCNWEEKLKEYANEPFSKVTVLAVANLAVFAFLISSGTVSKLIPHYVVANIPVAFGEEIEPETAFSGGLKPGKENKGIMPEATSLKGNDLSKAECEKDQEEGKCSNLCADIEQYIKVTKDMSEEEKRAWQKAAANFAAKKPRRSFSSGTVCAEKNDHPRKSDTKGKHRDEDCCPDPDEWPKPGCAYSAAGLALMMSGPR